MPGQRAHEAAEHVELMTRVAPPTRIKQRRRLAHDAANASMMPVTMPEMGAVGITMRTMVFHFGTPSA